jgi:hypothetical protein
MSLQSAPRLSYGFLPSRPVQIEISSAPLTSDAGLLPIREFDEQIRLTEQFAAAIKDKRDPTFTQQPVLTMVRQRIYGILADYEDQNDHDTLRSDPAFNADFRRRLTCLFSTQFPPRPGRFSPVFFAFERHELGAV